MYKNTTGYNKKLLTTFQISHMLRRQLYISVILSVVAAITAFSLYTLSIITLTIAITITLAYLVFLAILQYHQIWMRVRSSLKKGVLRLHYDFDETTFKVSSNNENEGYLEVLPYTSIQKVIVYKYIVMFYVNYREAFIMDKNGFTVGNFETFKTFIVEKVKDCKL